MYLYVQQAILYIYAWKSYSSVGSQGEHCLLKDI